MAVEVGKPAPDFSLVDSENNPVKLSDFRGKNVALFFFPAAFTSVCELQVTGHDRAIDEFRRLNTQVVGVSTDQRYALKVWLQQCGAKSFPVLSDHLRRAVQEYGVARETGAGNERATFLIDKDGIVRWMKIEAKTSDWIGIATELDELRKFAAAA
jgi:peroxiredoxin